MRGRKKTTGCVDAGIRHTKFLVPIVQPTKLGAHDPCKMPSTEKLSHEP